jgi:hypothetical protein
VSGASARAEHETSSTIEASALLAEAHAAGATRAPADKWQYHLLRPTPAELIPEMSTDRPDKTESPYTVDAGHFQVELDVSAIPMTGATPSARKCASTDGQCCRRT